MNETDANATPLHAMAPLSRFSDRAVDYAKYRPSYPAAAIAAILDELGNPSQLVAADVGAGTGISAHLLAERGVHVLAIEPNAAMREVAASHPLIEFCEATAEQTGLPDASVDLVVSCQAFHWFDPALSLLEFRRILRPSGRLALVWNQRDEDDPFTADYSRLIRTASDYHPAEKRLEAVKPLLTSSHFARVRHYTFAYKQELDRTELIGRTQSTSYLPRTGPAHQQLVSDLQALYDRWAGNSSGETQGDSSEETQRECDHVYLIYRTNVFLAEPNV